MPKRTNRRKSRRDAPVPGLPETSTSPGRSRSGECPLRCTLRVRYWESRAGQFAARVPMRNPLSIGWPGTGLMGVPADPPARRTFVIRDQPSKAEIEEQHVAHFRQWIQQINGRVLGPWTGRDGDPGIRVDFQFDREDPGLALEITTIVDPASEALQNELGKLEAELDRVAREEKLGCWEVAIRAGTRLVPLRDALTHFLRSQAGSAIPACYWGGEAPAGASSQRVEGPRYPPTTWRVSAWPSRWRRRRRSLAADQRQKLRLWLRLHLAVRCCRQRGQTRRDATT